MVASSADDGYMKKLYMKNMLDEYVSLSNTPSWGDSYDRIENLLNWDCGYDDRYFSESTANPFIMFEFKKRIPKIVQYSFETHYNLDISHPVMWDVKGANNVNGPWDLLDERNVNILKNYNCKANFSMKPCQYKFIKFTQFENYYVDSLYKNTFALKRIDFYTDTMIMIDKASLHSPHFCILQALISSILFIII